MYLSVSKAFQRASSLAHVDGAAVMKGQLPTIDVEKLLASYISHEGWLSDAISQLQGMKNLQSMYACLPPRFRALADLQSSQRAQISLMGLDMISHLEHAWYTLSIIPLGLRGVYDSALRASPSMGVNDYSENLRVKSRLDGLVLSMARKTSKRLANARPAEFLGCKSLKYCHSARCASNLSVFRLTSFQFCIGVFCGTYL